jgi:site-specific DNA-cytosine methylase
MRFFLVEMFSGSGSVGQAAEELCAAAALGDSVEFRKLSVDIHPKYNPTTCTDLLTWDYRAALEEFLAERAEEDWVVVWASPPCTQYSRARTTARAPRDLEGSDALVERALRIAAYCRPDAWFLENPRGLLRTRACVQGLHRLECSHCRYGKPFRKNTDIWSNADFALERCCKATPCEYYRAHRRHAVTAQSGVDRNGTRGSGRAEAVYPVPAPLVRQLLLGAFTSLD